MSDKNASFSRLMSMKTKSKPKCESEMVLHVKSELRLAIPQVVSFSSVSSLDAVFFNLFYTLIHFNVYHFCWHQVMIPTVKEIQNSITNLTNMVLEVSKGVTWPQEYSHKDSTEIGRLFHFRFIGGQINCLSSSKKSHSKHGVLISFCFIEGEKVNFHPRVIKNEDITNVLKILSKSVSSQKVHMIAVLKKYEPFKELWDNDRDLKYEVSNCLWLNAGC